jgi:CheY-like chemotaxis protein
MSAFVRSRPGHVVSRPCRSRTWLEVERRDEPVIEGTDGGTRVLIVDDETDMRHALSLLVESHGFEIVGEAGTGVEAIEMASQDPPDVVVMDYMMPEMDGAEAALRLRSIAPDTKIVAFSAILTEKPDWADAYLNKDRISQIASVIKEAAAS